MPVDYRRYPADWKRIRQRILERDGHRCRFCGVANHERGWRDASGEFHAVSDQTTYTGRDGLMRIGPDGTIRIVLTVAHLDHDITNNDDSNLTALCQRCHLRYDKVQHAASRRRRQQMNALPKWRVYYNTHAYGDCSDKPRPASRIVNAPSADEARETVRRMGRSGRRYIGMVHQAEPYEDTKTLRPADAEDVSTETLMPLFHPANDTIKAMSTIIWNTTPPDKGMPPATRVLVVWRGVVYAGVYFSRSRTVTLYPESDGKSVDIGNCTAWARWPIYYLPTVAEEQETKRLTLLHGDGV